MSKTFPQQRRIFLEIFSILLCVIFLLPIINLIREGLTSLGGGDIGLGPDGLKQIEGTFFLVLFSSLFGGTLGTVNGWLLANCRFKGRKYLRLAQLLPLATPAYLLSAILIDIGSIHGIRIHGMFWGILIMSLTTYPYVFLLSAESFAKCGQRQLEACRSLGIGPWNSFRRIALPMATPAIGAGIALMGMEVINELGAVQLLNIPSLSAGIVENWIIKGNPSGAIALAFIALLVVLVLVAYEKWLRKRSRRWTEGITGAESPAWVLKGFRATIAQALSVMPPLFTLGVPFYWAIINSDQLLQGFDIELVQLTFRSLMLGLIASGLTVLGAIFLSICSRWNKSKWMKSISFLSGLGYAIPGAVIALALLSFSGSVWNLPALILLLWGYSDRFLAVAKGGIDSAFERINPNIDEAAMSLGANWTGVLKTIHLPLLKGPLVVGSLLVFVDTIKELPLTFILRPFDFDTLSVRIFQYAGDERMGESIIPGLIVLLLGLLASIALMPSLDYKNKSI
ncbi:Ferric iron ABC transporter [Prochlorococcus marinus str. SS2]|uniref:ABC-type Fe3+ transport system permease component n=1 Tax=Prochlorococcus marinus (strain SARG / CCMP1375 / SS120) TaxID=167539 RepID=Q7VD95_PROMA|nr:ABC-type Fe3+ transport system permease component [Prochlorococcus marinus subsp. marinus str. CCMP1375]KGG21532.1 Ferric iron ABC transporter [Prochlorococcus marinus str. SS2]KGG23124.1 Ferric iron ABC transporter [Prochlorococcus marinus str. SS35]